MEESGTGKKQQEALLAVQGGQRGSSDSFSKWNSLFASKGGPVTPETSLLVPALPLSCCVTWGEPACLSFPSNSLLDSACLLSVM